MTKLCAIVGLLSFVAGQAPSATFEDQVGRVIHESSQNAYVVQQAIADSKALAAMEDTAAVLPDAFKEALASLGMLTSDDTPYTIIEKVFNLAQDPSPDELVGFRRGHTFFKGEQSGIQTVMLGLNLDYKLHVAAALPSVLVDWVDYEAHSELVKNHVPYARDSGNGIVSIYSVGRRSVEDVFRKWGEYVVVNTFSTDGTDLRTLYSCYPNSTVGHGPRRRTPSEAGSFSGTSHGPSRR